MCCNKQNEALQMLRRVYLRRVKMCRAILNMKQIKKLIGRVCAGK